MRIREGRGAGNGAQLYEYMDHRINKLTSWPLRTKNRQMLVNIIFRNPASCQRNIHCPSLSCSFHLSMRLTGGSPQNRHRTKRNLFLVYLRTCAHAPGYSIRIWKSWACARYCHNNRSDDCKYLWHYGPTTCDSVQRSFTCRKASASALIKRTAQQTVL